MAIDMEAMADKAAEQLGVKGNAALQALFELDAIRTKTMNLVALEPLMLLAMTSVDGMATLQYIVAWYWQMGRLYGQQETMDKVVGGMEGV